MEKKINIAKLLQDCPKGMELDCTIWDNVVFDHVDMKSNYPIRIKKLGGVIENLTEDGHFNFDLGAKCVIFPKGRITWKGFDPSRQFKNGDIVALDNEWGTHLVIFKEWHQGCEGDYADTHCGLNYQGELHFYTTPCYITRVATEKEKQRLLKALERKGYSWNSETKTIEELTEPKLKVNDNTQEETTMKLWIARDKKDYLRLYYGKPTWRPHPVYKFEYWYGGPQLGVLDENEFPEITFESSPQEVELKLLKKE